MRIHKIQKTDCVDRVVFNLYQVKNRKFCSGHPADESSEARIQVRCLYFSKKSGHLSSAGRFSLR